MKPLIQSIDISKMSTSSNGSTEHFTTNDGVKLAYELAGSSGPVLVLIHGWSGSRKYFQRNIPTLAQHCQVYAVDLRHHGDSSSAPPRGYHISRLAADLRDFLEVLDLNDVTVVGTSMGCAVIWSYVELFGTKRIGKAVFVDQAPLQNRTPDWNLGSKGCYDEASLRQLQQQLAADLGVIADGNAAGCLSLPVPAPILEELKQETLRCDGLALGAIMADHTQLDWRPVLPLLTLPCLNMVGQCSGVFPVDGCLSVSKLAPNCCSVVFKRANHWLYLEQPEDFNQVVLNFIKNGIDDRGPISYVE